MRRNRIQAQNALVKLMDKGYRPSTFKELDETMPWLICGQYKNEALGLWNALHDKDIKSFVEIGRNRGGGLYLFSCMFPELKNVLSIDLEYSTITDDAFPKYFNKINVSLDLVRCDSTIYDPKSSQWDFVYIDGGHTGEIVKKDIEIWKDRTKYIGFHDFADKGYKNKHKKVYQDVVLEILNAEAKYGWTRIGTRGRSEIVFKT